MPIIKSAAKRMRQTTTRTSLNNRYRRQMRDASKQASTDIAKQDKKAATESLSQAQTAIDKAVKKGVIHKNTAARRKSQLTRAFNRAFETSKTPAKTTKAASKPASKKPAAKKSPSNTKKTTTAKGKKTATKKNASSSKS